MLALTFATHDVVEIVYCAQLRMNKRLYQTFIVMRQY
jgi:hypothetical protein